MLSAANPTKNRHYRGSLYAALWLSVRCGPNNRLPAGLQLPWVLCEFRFG